MTESDRDLYLRRLRFPPDLERAYRDDYYRRSLKSIRAGLAVTALILFGLTIQSLGSQGLPIDNVILTSYPLVTLALTYWPRFNRIWQPYLALTTAAAVFYMLAGIAQSVGGSPDFPSVRSQVIYVAFNLGISFVIGVVIMRMPFLWTTAWLALVQIGSIAIMERFLRPDMGTLVESMRLTMIVAVFLMIATLNLERYHRADFLANRLLDAERAKSEALLLNILPGSIAERLKVAPETIADSYADVSVLFADIVDFTPLAASMEAPDVVQLLNAVFSAFDDLAERNGLEKIKTIGDAYMVVGGLPEPCQGHAEAIADMALAMQESIGGFKRNDGDPLRLRIGINSGSVVAGVIGSKRFLYDLWGDTVNMASRMESHGSPGGIMVTESTRARLSGSFEFGEGEATDVKGRGTMTTYRLLRRKPDVA